MFNQLSLSFGRIEIKSRSIPLSKVICTDRLRTGPIDHIRKKKTETKKKAEILAQSKEFVEYRDYEDSYRVKEKIFWALNQIKPKYRKVFTLSKIEGLTYDEIAEYLNISKRTVEYNMARALESLCGLLKDKV